MRLLQSDPRNRPTSERWRRVEDLYHRANERSESDREAFLDEACGGDRGLRREVESLLGYASEAEPFMETPAVQAPESTADSQLLPEGCELGSYRIHSLLGAGGMGKVYLAKDTRLGRTVAIKVLEREKVADDERKRRFMLEARAASALNHPNIVTLYDIARDSGVDFLVMEYVEGQSLHNRISPKGLSLEEILTYSTQIVSALAAAHAAGIVHRDIKPANVMVSDKGVVKVLDFGLAKLAEASDPLGSDLPTEVTRTQRGVIVGTAAYMSPEQAAGKPVDARSDIFAVGVVLYEMLTGRRPFDRGSVLATLGAVMYEEPAPLSGIVKAAPPDVVRLVERCLRKDPNRRIQTMADLKVALEELQETLKASAILPEFRNRNRRWWQWAAIALAILVGAAAIFVLVPREAPPDVLAADFRPLTTMNGWEVTPSWSSNGDMIAFSGNRDGNMDIFMMTVAGGEPDRLTDSPWDEVAPRWSPNLASMAYVSNPGTGANIYLKPGLSHGGERLLAETKLPGVDGGFGLGVQLLGSNPWSTNSQELLYSGLTKTGAIAVLRINVITKEPVQLTSPAPGESDFNATWSFDGKRIAFDRVGSGGYSLWTIPADGSEKERQVLPFGSNTWGGSTWSADGTKLLYLKPLTNDTSNIWEVDVDSGRPPRPITSGPSWDQFPSVSRNGRLAYVRFGPHNVDLYRISYNPSRDGLPDGDRLTFHSGETFFPSFSPDARKLVYQSDQSGINEVYLLDLETKGQERNLTADAATGLVPDWSPDGHEIVYVSNQGGKTQLSIMDSEGGSRRTLTDLTIPDNLRSWSGGEIAPRWSPDGKSIAFIALADRRKALWLVDRDGSNPREILKDVSYFDWYDNRHILFASQAENGRVQIQTVELTSRAVTLLVQTSAIELDVSKDGSNLLYTGAGNHFGMNLWVQPLRPGRNGAPMLNGVARQITAGGGDWHVHKGTWSPDGKTIVYTRDSDQGNIYTIESYR